MVVVEVTDDVTAAVKTMVVAANVARPRALARPLLAVATPHHPCAVACGDASAAIRELSLLAG